MKKFLLFLFLFLFTIVDIHALELNSEHVVLYNLNDNQIVYELNKDEQTSIASLTKIMTTLVAIEHISNYDEKVTVRNDMFVGLKEANAAVIGLRHNQVVTYNDLLYGMFLASGADATRAITISLAGSEDQFVDWMNEKAKELGLEHTHFENTVGLDDKNHYSTVDEVATLLKVAMENEKFKEIFMTETYTFSDQSITVSSTFKKTAKNFNLPYDFILGAKTGYTDQAERCLASIAYDETNQIMYLLVTTNADGSPKHILDAVNLYHYYFNHYKYYPLVKTRDTIVTLLTQYSKIKEVAFYAPKDITKYLDHEVSKEEVILEYEGETIIHPNTKIGTKLGVVNVKYNNELIETIDIILTTSVPFSLFVFIEINKIYFIIGFTLLLLFCFIVIKVIKKHHNKKKFEFR